MKHITTLASFRKEARNMLTGKWLFATELTVIFCVIVLLSQAVSGTLFIIAFAATPLFGYGYRLSMLRLSRGEEITFEMLFEGFSKRSLTLFLAYIIAFVRIFLWSLLLIVPGIIAAYSYSQVFFILADHPEYSASEAIEESKRIMMGNKWRYFFLTFSFIGWAFLSVFTLFIGYFFLTPYMYVSFAKFYDSIKG